MGQPNSPLPEKPRAAQLGTPHQHATQSTGFQGQPQFQPLELPQTEHFRPSRPFTVGKVTLASFHLVFAIIALGLSLGLISFGWESDSLLGDIIAAAAAGATIIWQLADFLTMAARRTLYRPIHPGAHIGVHIVLDVLWLLVVSSLAISLTYTLSDWTVDSQCGESGTPGSYNDGTGYVYCSWDTFNSEDQAQRYFRMLEALVAFSALLAASHLALAILACVETHRRRKHGRNTAKVVYLVASPNPVDGRVYYSQVPAPPMAQPQAQALAPGAAADAGAYGYYAPAHPAPAQAPAHPAPAQTPAQ